ncbi:MAG: iron-siderophore ABC transporter substrate-binding protein [Solirubrobacteraceae bacterium]|nr:iron-siderophore ABC transporter substrate-binding protein [Solirubrobacteraceae bacterium]
MQGVLDSSAGFDRARLRALALAVIAAVVGVGMAAPAADAAPKRVVALEWEYVEDLLAVGVTPVGAADLGGFRTWVAIRLPGGIKDVGTRQEPSLERIAALKPDLIITPTFRSAKTLETLRKIAPTMALEPYPAGRRTDEQYVAMVNNFRRIAKRVGRSARGERVISDLARTQRSLKAKLRRGGRSRIKVTVIQPGGTVGSPQLRLFTRNSLTNGVLRRLGLRNNWTVRNEKYGFSTVGMEALRRVQNGWAAFIYPSQYASTVKRFTSQASFRNLNMVKKRRVRSIAGNTWPFGGPISTKLYAQRLAAALLKR